MLSQNIRAYTRDPIALFNEQTLTGSARELQPVIYRNMLLNTVCYHETRVNWHTNELCCFADADDAMNNVPIMQTIFCLPAAPRSQDEYVRETFEFLQRGHSMLEPQCTCRVARCVELGVTRTVGSCVLPRLRERRSFNEIARELCIQELEMSLLDALVRLAGMIVTDGHYLHSPLCCVPPFIADVEDVATAAKMLAPFPYQLKCDTFNALLQKRTDVLLVSPLVFSRTGAPPVSDDLRDMWHEALQKDNIGSLERSLKAVGQTPTKMMPVRFVPRKRPAPPPKRNSRWKSMVLKPQ